MALLLSLSLIIAMLIALICWAGARRAGGSFIKWSGALLICALVVEVIALVLRSCGLHNTLLYNIFTCIELLFFLRLVKVMVPDRKRAVTMSGAVGLIAMAVNYVRYKEPDFLLTEGIIIVAAIMTGWSMVVLWRAAQHSERPLIRTPSFWFYMGAMVYFGGIVPFVGMMFYLYQNDRHLTALLYGIINVLAVLRYLLTAWAYRLARAQRMWE
ncbi:MAG TPA: hypothetical protein VGE21_06545 [Flavobacteriales bacterium]